MLDLEKGLRSLPKAVAQLCGDQARRKRKHTPCAHLTSQTVPLGQISIFWHHVVAHAKFGDKVRWTGLVEKWGAVLGGERRSSDWLRLCAKVIGGSDKRTERPVTLKLRQSNVWASCVSLGLHPEDRVSGVQCAGRNRLSWSHQFNVRLVVEHGCPVTLGVRSKWKGYSTGAAVRASSYRSGGIV